MTTVDPSDQTARDKWYAEQLPFFRRAEETLTNYLERFVDDWEDEYDFRVESAIAHRIKSPERLAEKCTKRGISDMASLLERDFKVTDIIGARVVLRSTPDIEAFKEAFNTSVNQDACFEVLRVDDKNETPSLTGYRAVHLDLALSETIRTVEKVIPAELQVKTLLQAAWGDFTHDEAYSRTALNDDPRFAIVRNLQRALADSLNSADLLQSHIEKLSADTAWEILHEPIGKKLTLASVLHVVYENLGHIPRLEDAQRILDTARGIGIASVAAFKDAIDVDPSAVDDVVENFTRRFGRRPRPAERVIALLEARRIGQGLTDQD
jgi:ppGpp synthetase/RelA/SpoT-type nucleotidyltranferase